MGANIINKLAARILSIPLMVLAAFVAVPSGFIWQTILYGPFCKGVTYGQRFNRWMYDGVE